MIRDSVSGTGYWEPVASGYKIQDAGIQVLGVSTGYWILDAGYWMLGAYPPPANWVRDTGNRNSGFGCQH